MSPSVQNIMKLSQGEYVALERIENSYDLSPVIAQIYVHGDSLRDHLVGIVVPDPMQLAPLVSKIYNKPIAPEDSAALAGAIKDPRIMQAILDEMDKAAKNADLKGYVSSSFARLVFGVYAYGVALRPSRRSISLLTPSPSTTTC